LSLSIAKSRRDEKKESLMPGVRSIVRQIKDRWKRWKYESNPRKFWERRGAKDNFQEYPQDMLMKQRAFFIGQFSKLEFSSALEVGCGHGRVLRFLRERLDEPGLILGVDFARPQLLKARASLGDRCHLVQASALSLPFKDNAIDLVYSVDMLLHIPPHNVREALQEIIRVSAKYVMCAEGIYTHFNMYGLDFRREYETLGLKTIKYETDPYPVLRPKRNQFVVLEKALPTSAPG
jgi:ubiquinone/menaquinone biosynthesis C-methylase UbiE